MMGRGVRGGEAGGGGGGADEWRGGTGAANRLGHGEERGGGIDHRTETISGNIMAAYLSFPAPPYPAVIAAVLSITYRAGPFLLLLLPYSSNTRPCGVEQYVRP